jgi:hypothetical protein
LGHIFGVFLVRQWAILGTTLGDLLDDMGDFLADFGRFYGRHRAIYWTTLGDFLDDIELNFGRCFGRHWAIVSQKHQVTLCGSKAYSWLPSKREKNSIAN